MKSTKIKRSSWGQIVFFYLMGILAGLVLLVGLMRVIYHTKFYPGVVIGNVNVAGLTKVEAEKKLIETTGAYRTKLSYGGGEWEVSGGMFEFQLESTLNEAYSFGRRVNLNDYLMVFVDKKQVYPIKLGEGTGEELASLITTMASAIEIPPQEAELDVVKGEINIINGSDGVLIDGQELDLSLRERVALQESNSVEVPTRPVRRLLNTEEIEKLKQRAETMLKKEVILKLEDESFSLRGEMLLKYLESDGSEKIVDTEVLGEYVEGLANRLNRKPQDAKFEFEDGVVKEFAPGKDGIEVSIEYAVLRIEESLKKLLDTEDKKVEIEIVVTRTPPKVTTEKVNELGIKERIGRGESYYAHSIPNRVFNVGLAAERTNAALIAPGEEYSFNKEVGEISGATGYRTAYVISGGRTVLGDGGGVCQVSTTIFRAAMNAGLPITERWAHAYRVGYYEQNSKPGVDATVYSPSKDLRFKNDTPGHILIQTINDPKNLHLVVEIYGTNDGRVASVSEPKIWGVTGPLPTAYQDDPTIPSGQLRQVDWAASGAKTSFEYKVERNGEVLQDKVFSSNYRPWASVYLRGTGQ